jgi:uncharacterized protein
MLHTIRAMCICAALMVIGKACLLQAQPMGRLESRGYVSDFANVLDPQSVESIVELCHRLEYWTGVQANVVIVRSLDGARVENYTATLFNQWRLDPDLTNLGVLILLAPREHLIHIHVAPSLRHILSDSIPKFEREAIPYVNRHEYGPAMTLLTRRVAIAIAEDAKVGLREVQSGTYLGDWSPAAQPYDVLVGSLIAMALTGVLAIAVAIIKIRKRNISGHVLTLGQICESK